MRLVVLVLGLLVCGSSWAALPPPLKVPPPPADVAAAVAPPMGSASGLLSFSLTAVDVGKMVASIYADAFRTPYVLAPEVLGDQRQIAFRFSGTPVQVRAYLGDLLDSLGYAITSRGGVDFIGPKGAAVSPGDEVFVYHPRFRDVNYLTEMLRPFFTGRFATDRGAGIAAPAGSKASDASPVGTAAALVDRRSDTLVFSGPPVEVAKLKSLLAQVDYEVGEVMVRGVVYEVQTSEKSGSAFSLAASILSGKLSLSVTGAALDHVLHLAAGNVDAVFSALSSDSHFRVVTRPSLRVRSGRQAVFSVGQDVPTLGSVSYADNGTPVQSVEYRSSGVIFKVTPEVREDVIDLDLDQELSNFVQTTTGVDNSPTLTKRALSTDVQLRPGEIVMLGGMSESKTSDGRSGFSFLPRWLRGSDKSSDKTELLLVLQVERVGGAVL